MKTLSKLLLLVVCCMCVLGSCNKDKTPPVTGPVTTDLKKKTLPELKAFLNGDWQLQYSIIYGYAGYTKYSGDGDLFFFFNRFDNVD